MKDMVRSIAFACIALSTALVLVVFLRPWVPGDPSLKQRIVNEGAAATGAQNLVTGLYLGYRAIDTLGETVILFLAVSGVVFLMKRQS